VAVVAVPGPEHLLDLVVLAAAALDPWEQL